MEISLCGMVFSGDLYGVIMGKCYVLMWHQKREGKQTLKSPFLERKCLTLR